MTLTHRAGIYFQNIYHEKYIFQRKIQETKKLRKGKKENSHVDHLFGTFY